MFDGLPTSDKNSLKSECSHVDAESGPLGGVGLFGGSSDVVCGEAALGKKEPCAPALGGKGFELEASSSNTDHNQELQNTRTFKGSSKQRSRNNRWERNRNRKRMWWMANRIMFGVDPDTLDKQFLEERGLSVQAASDLIRKHVLAQVGCGTARWREVFVGVKIVNGEIRIGTEGLKSCKKRHTCPLCSGRVRANQAQMCRDSFEEHVSRYGAGSIFALALTVDHAASKDHLDWHLTEKLLTDSFRIFSQKWRKASGLAERTGWKAQVKRLEETYSEYRYHPHLHLGVFSFKDMREVYITSDEKANFEKNGFMEFPIGKDGSIVKVTIEELNNYRISLDVWKVWQDCTSKVLARMQSKGKIVNCRGHIKKPFLESYTDKNGRSRMIVKGGVSAEVMKDGDKYADYLSKEINLSSTKIGKNAYDGSKRYVWQELTLLDETWAKHAFIFHELNRYRRMTFNFSVGKWEEDGDRMSYYNYLFPDKDEEQEQERQESVAKITHSIDAEQWDKLYRLTNPKVKILTDDIGHAFDIREFYLNTPPVERAGLDPILQRDIHEMLPEFRLEIRDSEELKRVKSSYQKEFEETLKTPYRNAVHSEYYKIRGKIVEREKQNCPIEKQGVLDRVEDYGESRKIVLSAGVQGGFSEVAELYHDGDDHKLKFYFTDSLDGVDTGDEGKLVLAAMLDVEGKK